MEYNSIELTGPSSSPTGRQQVHPYQLIPAHRSKSLLSQSALLLNYGVLLYENGCIKSGCVIIRAEREQKSANFSLSSLCPKREKREHSVALRET